MPQIQGEYIPASTDKYSSSAAEEAAQVKASPGLLYGFIVTNYNAAARFLYVFNHASASSGTPLIPSIPLQSLASPGSTVAVFLPFALPFDTGLRFASSSTGATFTASATSDLRITALYK